MHFSFLHICSNTTLYFYNFYKEKLKPKHRFICSGNENMVFGTGPAAETPANSAQNQVFQGNLAELFILWSLRKPGWNFKRWTLDRRYSSFDLCAMCAALLIYPASLPPSLLSKRKEERHHYCTMCTLNGVCHETLNHYFLWFKPLINKQAKIFSKLVSIL